MFCIYQDILDITHHSRFKTSTFVEWDPNFIRAFLQEEADMLDSSALMDDKAQLLWHLEV